MKNRLLFLVVCLGLVFVFSTDTLISQGSLAAKICAKRYPNPKIKFLKQDAAGRVYIPVVNAAAYSNILFKPAPKLPPCGSNRNSARTWVGIYDGKTNKRIYGFCALKSNAGLKKIWFHSKAKFGRVYIVINDRLCKRKYRSNTLFWGKPPVLLPCAKRYPNPKIKFLKRDAAGRVYIPVINAAAYSNILFKPAPKLPPCGANKNSARTWVGIFDGKTNKRIYGFCALNSNAGLKKIWFHSKAKFGRVYIVINDRLCKRKYRSNTLVWGRPIVNLCAKRYPNPKIKFLKQDAAGRVYIPVVNAAAYSNILFKPAPKLPPCGANKKSARTWVGIFDGKTNKRIYGFCALNSNAGLKKIWFHSKAKFGRVYIVINDRLCKRKYRSNTLIWGKIPINPCARRYPNPRIKFDKVDRQGRVYIPVVNWAAYSNSMFAAAPKLPPCGANKNSSRTWVDIYDARTKKRLYGFCAFNSKDDLKGIWFKPQAARAGVVFIVIKDRRCKKSYKSNPLTWRM